MPSLFVPITGLYESVLRPLATKVARDVMAWTGVPTDTPLRFYNDGEVDSLPGSTVDENGKVDKFTSRSKVNILVTESYRESATATGPNRTPDEPYIFIDQALGIALKPIRSYNDVLVAFTYRARTRSEVEAWRDDFRIRLAEDRQPLLHECSYHYGIPDTVQYMLAHFHELRENVAGYGQSLGEWFDQSFHPDCSIIDNFNGSVSHRVHNEHVVGIQGWFDFTEPTEADKSQENSTWTITFNYHFMYMKPVEFNFVYPHMIHNQLINKQLFSTKPLYRLRDQPINDKWPKSTNNWKRLDDMRLMPEDPLSGIRVPTWDEWVPTHTPPGTTSIISWMISVVPDQPDYVVDLKSLGKQKISDNVMEFLAATRSKVTTLGKSIFHFGLYAGNVPVEDKALYLDENMILRSRIPMNLRVVYHVRLSAVIARSMLDREAYEDAAEWPGVTLDLWGSLLPELDIDYMESRLPLSEADWNWYYDQHEQSAVSGKELRRVQTLTIIMKK